MIVFCPSHCLLLVFLLASEFGVCRRCKKKRKKSLNSLLPPPTTSSSTSHCSMSPNLDSPVQTQMAVTVLNSSLRADYLGSKSDSKPAGRRRLFVQTETGFVLGIEVDRGDNAHTVKRRLELAFNVPTEQSSLTFGDLVLKDDLSAVRKDSPLLLRRNILHRSSSSPCLSPRGKDLHQRDYSGPVEILGCSSHCSQTKQLVKDVVKAVKSGVEPLPVHSGLGGAYYFRNTRGDSVAIVKPTDEEPFAPNNPKGFIGKALGQPGLKRSVRVGETGFREVAAYLLDYDHFANVPPTVLVKISHSVFNVNDVNGQSNKTRNTRPVATSKIASFQKFIHHDFDASDHGTSSFPVSAVHRIGILDVRIFNTDRHGGNLLVRKVDGGMGKFNGQMELIPIDHGLCLPESLEDPYFEWIHWPQSAIPFSEDELEYIANLDPLKDADMLRRELPMIRNACLRILVLCTIFLKEAAGHGLCLAEIGEMMSREFKRMEEEPSDLERICMEARRLIGEEEQSSDGYYGEEEEFQFDLDCEEDDNSMPKCLHSCNLGSRGSIGRTFLSKLDESLVEEDNGEDECEELDTELLSAGRVCLIPPNFSKLSMSANGVGVFEKSQFFRFGKWKGQSSSSSKGLKSSHNFSGGLQGTNSRSVTEQLPASTCFVRVADMDEEEWAAFLEKFQELLPNALQERKSGAFAQSQRQRLGTSCQLF